MSEIQDKDSIPEDKYVRTCNIVTFLLVLLVLGAALLHFKDDVKQKELLQAMSSSQSQWSAPTSEFGDGQSKVDEALNGIDPAYVSMGLYLLMLGLLAFLHLNVFRPAIASLAEQRKQLNRYAAIDPLTGVYNRAMLFKVARQLIGTYKRQEQPLAALTIDIDKLRRVNETYGRAAGDALIKKVAATISATLRSSDVLGRLGGGEFGVFLPSIDKMRAEIVAEKIRAAIQNMQFALKEKTILATASIGVVEMNKHHDSPDALFLSAELALGRAKEEGGNRAAAFTFVETGK